MPISNSRNKHIIPRTFTFRFEYLNTDRFLRSLAVVTKSYYYKAR